MRGAEFSLQNLCDDLLLWQNEKRDKRGSRMRLLAALAFALSLTLRHNPWGRPRSASRLLLHPPRRRLILFRLNLADHKVSEQST